MVTVFFAIVVGVIIFLAIWGWVWSATANVIFRIAIELSPT